MLSGQAVTYSFPKLALPISVALHVAFGVWVEVRAGELETARPIQTDRFSGEGIDVATVVTAGAAHPDAVQPPRAEPAGIGAVRPAATAVEPEAPRPLFAKAAEPAAPRPPARHRVVSPAAGVRAEPPAGSSSDTAPSSPPAGFGAAGLPPGVRHLPKAFARAIALANRADLRWRGLAPGIVDETSVVLTVADDGTLGKLSYPVAGDETRIAPVVRKLLDNTVLLLASGKFSLDAGAVSPGTMRLRVRVEIEQQASGGADVDPDELHALDYEPPRPGKRGHGAFVLNSGRRVVAWISVE